MITREPLDPNPPKASRTDLISPIALGIVIAVLTAVIALIVILLLLPGPRTSQKKPDNGFVTRNLDRVLDSTRGNIPILEYHIIESPSVTTNLFLSGILKKDRTIRRFVVTSDEFRSQLSRLYEAGFRNISLNEYLALRTGAKQRGLDRLRPGNRLYVLTFDDATYGQFDYLGRGPDGRPVIDPDCAVGIMLDFARSHPEFALNAAFAVDFENPPFLAERDVRDKLNRLLDLGFEIVNHTRSHRKLSSYLPGRPRKAEFELGGAMELFRKNLGERAESVDKVCYPDGRSNPAVWEFLKGFDYNGRHYTFSAGLDAKGYQALHPDDRSFNPYNISRIETSELTFQTFVLNAPSLYRVPTDSDLLTDSDYYSLTRSQTEETPCEIIRVEY